MVDGYGRTIDYLRLSVTNLCDLRCRYCVSEDGPGSGELLPAEELVEIAAAAVDRGVRKIRLTGGEPLTRPDLLDICRCLRALPGLEELCLTTNGSRLAELAVPLREAGVDRLNVSVDTLRRLRYTAMTRGGRLEAVRDGIAAAEAAGFRDLKLNAVLINGFNDDEIEDFVNLTQTHPWEVRFIELMPIGECAGWDKGYFLSCEAVLERVPGLVPLDTQGVARRYRLPGAAGTVGLISPLSRDFCGGCRRLRVTADGKLKGCLHSAAERPLRGLHGEALREAIQAVALEKPLRHHLSEGRSDTPRNMNEIGG